MNGPEPRPRRFANPSVVVRSWYVAGGSSMVRAGQVRTVDLLGRRIALYRDAAGLPHALDARCPHLGADLGEGVVQGDGVRCALHGWCFGPDGACRAAPLSPPGRRTRSYPIVERWGQLWIFNGPEPDFPLPDLPGGGWSWQWCPPPQRIRAHFHLVVGNGLDAYHFPVLHDMEFTAEPRYEQSSHEVTLTMRGHPRKGWVRWITGTSNMDFEASFSCIGGSLAWATVHRPIPAHALFTGRPASDGGCDTRTILFLRSRSPRYVLRSIALWAFLLRDDRRILDTMEFRPAFTDADEGMKRLCDLVEAMEVY